MLCNSTAVASGRDSRALRRVSRRQFGRAATGVAAAGISGAAILQPVLAQPQADEGDWIDAHVHVWTPDTERYPLAAGYEPAQMQPPSFTPEQLFAHCRPAGVRRIVLIQMSFYGFDNRYMLDVMAAHPGTFSGVGIVDAHATDVRDQIKRLVRQGVRGLRVHPAQGEAAAWTRDPATLQLWQAARDQGIAICPLINPTDLPHVAAMCDKLPGLTVVVDHFARIGIDGRIDRGQLDTLCSLARYPDVYVKTSAFYALGQKRPPYRDLHGMIRRVVDAFGPQRLMWASDCPFQVQDNHSYEASIAVIRDRIDFLSPADKEAMLRGTADSVFFASAR